MIMSAPKFTYETKRVCSCGRTVDAVRSKGLDGLRLARHFSPTGLGLCRLSLSEADPRAPSP